MPYINAMVYNFLPKYCQRSISKITKIHEEHFRRKLPI
jgi:hypothetical protein